MNPKQAPDEKIEILPEVVTSADIPYSYKSDELIPGLPEVVERPEQVGLGLVSLVSAIGFPVIVGMLWSTVKINVTTPEEVVTNYAVGSIVLFLILIFIIPFTTIFSLISGYLAFKRSRAIGRYLAIGSFIVTAVGVVLLVLFIAALQQSTPTT